MSSIRGIVCSTMVGYYRNMPKKKARKQSDGSYLLKLVMYIIFGSLWVKFAIPITIGSFTLYGIPFGLFIGLLFASHDHFQVDRKIEYALLLLMTILTYFMPAGVVL